MASRRLRKSKLDDHLDIVGVLSDKEVADRAGVTPENVRTFRMRRVIPALWRGQTEEELRERLGARGQLPDPRPTRKKRKKKRKERKSALDPFKHLLGQIPDRQVADMAGVSPENVRAYRKRRGIPAAWRDGTAEAPVVAEPPKASKAAKAPKASRKAAAPPAPPKRRGRPPGSKNKPKPKPAPASAVTPEGAWAWKLVAEVGSDRREFVTFGGSMLDAVERGSDQLKRLHRAGQIVEVHRIAPVL